MNKKLNLSSWAIQQTIGIFGVDNIKIENGFINLLNQQESKENNAQKIKDEIDKKIVLFTKDIQSPLAISEYDSYSQANGTLINNYNIQNTQNLNILESMLSAKAMYHILIKDNPETFHHSIVKKYHYLLFKDIYPWAGEFRNVDISKNDTHFENVENINNKLFEIFEFLRLNNYLIDLEKNDLIIKVAYFLGEINRVHPFREGNGRTQRLITTQLLLNAGYEIKWSGISDSAMKKACIDFSNGNVNTMIKLMQIYVDNFNR